MFSKLVYKGYMTLRQLISKNNYKKVFNIIRSSYYVNSSYGDIVSADVGFRRVWDSLIALQPAKDSENFVIFISEIFDDLSSQYYIDVSLRDLESDSLFSMDFSCWSEIIDLKIEDAVGLKQEELLAHILWQISYWGFSQGESLKKKDEITKLWRNFQKEFKKDFDDL